MSQPNTLSLSKRKHSIANQFANASSYGKHATVQKKICELITHQVPVKNYDSILEVGAGTGILTKYLAKKVSAKNWHINDLTNKSTHKISQILPNAKFYFGDAELMDLGTNHDLIVSANAIQWFDNPLSFIGSSAQKLRSGGHLLFNTFTPNNFYQIKNITGYGLQYPTVEQWEDELNKFGFNQIDISIHNYTLCFDTPAQVLKHIRDTGVSTANKNESSFVWTKSSLQQFYCQYTNQYSNSNQQVELCYEVLLISAVNS